MNAIIEIKEDLRLKEPYYRAIVDYCQRNDISTVFLTETDMITKTRTACDFMVGTVAFIKWGLADFKFDLWLDYPPQLTKYLPRSIMRGKLGECYGGPPVFLKPVKTKQIDLGPSYLIPRHVYRENEDIEVWILPLVGYSDEVRAYVHKGKIVGTHRYIGYNDVPISLIKSMVACYTDAPVAYTLDVGQNMDGEWKLIEVNDFWAVGPYSLKPSIYVDMLADRWAEIKSS